MGNEVRYYKDREYNSFGPILIFFMIILLLALFVGTLPTQIIALGCLFFVLAFGNFLTHVPASYYKQIPITKEEYDKHVSRKKTDN